MKKKYFSGLLTAILLGASHSSYADSILRMATAKVAVTKTTMTKVNGKYQRKDQQVCLKQVKIPVVDLRVPGQPQTPKNAPVNCLSEVKGKPVHVVTIPTMMIDKIAEIPWKLGQPTDVKFFGALSYVYSEHSSIDTKTLQDSLTTMSYSEDLSLKELGLSLVPHISISFGNCIVQTPPPPGGNPPCQNDETVNLEEFFTSVVYIEDKDN